MWPIKVSVGPLKLPLMFVHKIADFRSGKAEPYPGIVDLRLDQPKSFGGSGMQTVNQFWNMCKGAWLKKLDHIMKRLLRAAVRAC